MPPIRWLPQSIATAIVCDNYVVGENGVGECLHQFPKEITVL